jgi:hypothetical protein
MDPRAAALKGLGEEGLLDLVEELHARVAALEDELARLRRPKGPDNSSHLRGSRGSGSGVSRPPRVPPDG